MVDHFVFFCFNVPCISTENKTGVPCLFFVYLNKRIFFVTHAHEKLNEYVVVLLPSLHIIDIFFKSVIRGLILGQAENHFNFSEYFKNSPREN